MSSDSFRPHWFRAFTWVGACLAGLPIAPLQALEKPDTTYQIFQFPADRIPRIDGNTDDWAGSYVVILDISGPDGKARHSKVWDIQLR